MAEKDIVESYREKIVIARQMGVDGRAATLTRLVWFVGIAGYVLVNGRQLWDGIAGVPLVGFQLFCLTLLWVLSALAAVAAHVLVDEVGAKDNLYFITKLAAIDLYQEALQEANPDPYEMVAIMNDKPANISRFKAASDALARKALVAYQACLWLLGIGFVWSTIFPLWLR